MSVTDPGNPKPDLGEPVPMPGGPEEPVTPLLPDPDPTPEPAPTEPA